MPANTITTEVMKALPQTLRPNPYNIEEEVMDLAAKGWKPIEIAEHVIRDGATNPGLTVHSIRQAKNYPPPSTRTHRSTGPKTHTPCTDGHPNCQLCWCDNCPQTCNLTHQHTRTPTHHTSEPMPNYVREALQDALTSTRIPD